MSTRDAARVRRSPSDQAASVLERLPLFAPLPRRALVELASRSEPRDYPRGRDVTVSGAPAGYAVVVARGRLGCWLGPAGSRDWMCGVLRVGDLAGLPAVVLSAQYGCSTRTLERSRVLLVPARAVHDLLSEDVAFLRRVTGELARRQLQFLRAAQAITSGTPLARVARYLGEQIDSTGECDLDLPQRLVAAHLGTVREIVGRCLRKLEDEGVIAREGRHVRILAPVRLAELAG